uniref:Uncharacterized protein U16 n=1 Tax=Hyposoter didymator TaxID=260305 RepID=D7P5P5_HYPDD|nr:unknown [Hyposoter didymator]
MVKSIEDFVFQGLSTKDQPSSHLFPRKCMVTRANTNGFDALDLFAASYKPQIGQYKCFQEKNGCAPEQGYPYRIVVDLDSSDEHLLQSLLYEIGKLLEKLLCQANTSDFKVMICIMRKQQTGRFHVHLLNVVTNDLTTYKNFLIMLHEKVQAVDKGAGVNYFMVFGAIKAYKLNVNPTTPAADQCYLPWKLCCAEPNEIDLNNFVDLPGFTGGSCDEYLEDIYNYFKKHFEPFSCKTLFHALSLHRRYNPDFDVVLPSCQDSLVRCAKRRANEDSDSEGKKKVRTGKSDPINRAKESFFENVLFKLPRNYYEEYDSWIGIGKIIAYVKQNYGLHLFHKFSAQSRNKYDAEKVTATYEGLLETIKVNQGEGEDEPAIRTTSALRTLLLGSNSIIDQIEHKMFYKWKGDTHAIVGAVNCCIQQMSPMLTFPHPLNANYLFAIEFSRSDGAYRISHDTFIQSFGGQRATIDAGVERHEHYERILECFIYLAIKYYNDNHRFLRMYTAHGILDSTPFKLKNHLHAKNNAEDMRSSQYSFYRRAVVQKLNKLKKRWFLAQANGATTVSRKNNKRLWSKLYAEFEFHRALQSARKCGRYPQSVLVKAVTRSGPPRTAL